MSAEIVAMLGGFTTLLASGGTFAMFMFRLFLRLEGRVDRLEGKVDDLAHDVSEMRGELRRALRRTAGGGVTAETETLRLRKRSPRNRCHEEDHRQ